MNCDSELLDGDRRRHQRRSVCAVDGGIGEMDALRPWSDAVNHGSRSAGSGRRKSDQGRSTNARRHEAVELPNQGARSEANPAIGRQFCLYANRDASSCNLGSRVRGARLNPSAASRRRSARLSLCVNEPSGEQDSIRRVRFGPETKPTSVLRRNRWLKPQTTVIRHGLPSHHHVAGVRFTECVCSQKHRTVSRGARPATPA